MSRTEAKFFEHTIVCEKNLAKVQAKSFLAKLNIINATVYKFQMSIISDASPLIFLSKIEAVHLIKDLFKGPYLIPSIVYREVLDSTVSEEEKKYLEGELKRWDVKPVKIHTPLKGAGSLADWSVFELAHSIQPTVVLADDKFLRNILAARGLSTLGTLGLLSLAAFKKVCSKEKVIQLADLLVERYNLWIDAPTYSKFLKSLK